MGFAEESKNRRGEKYDRFTEECNRIEDKTKEGRKHIRFKEKQWIDFTKCFN